MNKLRTKLLFLLFLISTSIYAHGGNLVIPIIFEIPVFILFLIFILKRKLKLKDKGVLILVFLLSMVLTYAWIVSDINYFFYKAETYIPFYSIIIGIPIMITVITFLLIRMINKKNL